MFNTDNVVKNNKDIMLSTLKPFNVNSSLAKIDFRNVSMIYFDMDGVLADFKRGVKENLKLNPEVSDEIMWSKMKEYPHFYYDLLPIPEGVELFQKVQSIFGNNKVQILSAYPKPIRGIVDAIDDKRRWVKKYFDDNIKVNLVLREDKKRFCHSIGDILIDDYEKNIIEWDAAGGTSILFKASEVEYIINGIEQKL